MTCSCTQHWTSPSVGISAESHTRCTRFKKPDTTTFSNNSNKSGPMSTFLVKRISYLTFTCLRCSSGRYNKNREPAEEHSLAHITSICCSKPAYNQVRSATSCRQFGDKKSLKLVAASFKHFFYSQQLSAGPRQVSDFFLPKTCRRPGHRAGLRPDRSNGHNTLTKHNVSKVSYFESAGF